MKKPLIRQVRKKSTSQLYVTIPLDEEIQENDYVSIKKVMVE
jgi:hypothetical protein